MAWGGVVSADTLRLYGYVPQTSRIELYQVEMTFSLEGKEVQRNEDVLFGRVLAVMSLKSNTLAGIEVLLASKNAAAGGRLQLLSEDGGSPGEPLSPGIPYRLYFGENEVVPSGGEALLAAYTGSVGSARSAPRELRVRIDPAQRPAVPVTDTLVMVVRAN